MRTSAPKLWIILFCVIKHTELSDIDAKITYAEFGAGLNLSCNCFSKNTGSQIKRWCDNDGLIKESGDDWGPKLFNGGEILKIQSVRNLDKNITYECRVVGQNGSEEHCQKYTVQAFRCRPNTESIEPENKTNLELGDSPMFTCKQYFACNKVNEVHSVSMRTKAKRSRVLPCIVSDHGLTHDCKLQILNIAAEDFGKAVQCVVNDSGIISVYEAFPFKKEKIVNLRQPSEIIIALSVIFVMIILLAIIVIKVCFCNQKYKSKCKCLSPLDYFNSEYKNNPQILVYSVLEEDDLLSTRLFSLNELLQDFYKYKTYDKDIKEGENIIGAFSELAKESLALIIVVDVGLLKKDEDYKNKFTNVLNSDAAKGKCRIRPYYTSVLYNYENCCEFQGGIKECYQKNDLEKKFVSFDIKGNQTDVEKVIMKKLKKRLPPISASDRASKSKHNCISKVTSNGNYKSCESANFSVNKTPNSCPDYSRMESYMSSTSETPLFIS
ncbi:uncharacterized protein LOC133181082 [Saccostrea echinata]|uniref:uncharacterized protein LOC133181082 n=1 Tax=Saccostrea echinata TaxID=191078 RepID=UPI002A83A4FA|nr:uncharacterized protein LOC133181082 [Saccostrea echinata]